MRAYTWLLWLLVGGLPAAAVGPSGPPRGGDGQSLYRCMILLAAPGNGSVSVAGGTILTFNTVGRVVFQHRFDADEFRAWSGGRVRLNAGEQVIFSHQQSFPAADRPVRTQYIFDLLDAAGGHHRETRTYDLSGAQPRLVVGNATGSSGVQLEVYCAPDDLVAVRLGRTRRTAWGFSLWLQETGGVAVTVQEVAWLARAADGQPLGEGHLDAAAITALAGGPQCGPDGLLVLPGQRLVQPAGAAGGEVVVRVAARSADGPVTAMGRFALLPPAPQPAKTALRMPFQGLWRVARGPGDGWPSGLAYTWVFERLDAKGLAWAGDGARLKDHYSYGQPVLAPARGTVTESLATSPDPGAALGGGRFSSVAGDNYLVLDHGQGESSYLGGLAPGSLKAAVGQQVEAGEPLALVGCGETGLERPALLYRLVTGARSSRSRVALDALFGGWQAVGSGPAHGLPSAPETGDVVRVP